MGPPLSPLRRRTFDVSRGVVMVSVHSHRGVEEAVAGMGGRSVYHRRSARSVVCSDCSRDARRDARESTATRPTGGGR